MDFVYIEYHVGYCFRDGKGLGYEEEQRRKIEKVKNANDANTFDLSRERAVVPGDLPAVRETVSSGKHRVSITAVLTGRGVLHPKKSSYSCGRTRYTPSESLFAIIAACTF